VNLFVVGCGLTPERIASVRTELERTGRLYPQLDHGARWHREFEGGVIVGGVATPEAVAAPRVYVHSDERSTVVYDGLPVDPSGRLEAHRADQLAAAWTDLIETLEGRYAVVRVTHDPVAVELISDAVGAEQLYYHEDGRATLISNSAGLVQRVVGATDLDPLAASMFVAIDWVGGDRTLRTGVRVADGAQHWRWAAGDRAWQKRQFWNIGRNAGPPTRVVDTAFVDQTVADLTRFCAGAAKVSGVLNAPLTAGKDSRMLAAVLMASGLPVRYWTKGDAGSVDLAVGLEIARRHGLPHRVANRPTQAEDGRDPTRDIAAEWSRLAPEFVSQSDGLASLFNVGNIQGQPPHVDHLAVTLSAMCAESARPAWGQTWILSPGGSLKRAQRFLPFTMANRPGGLVTRQAFALTARHISDLMARWSDEGVPLGNLPAAFYIDERCRRWATNNPRELGQTEDKVLPFLTRPYVQTALAMRPEERALQRLHRGIIRRLVPDLELEPPFDIPWNEPGRPIRGRRRLMNEIGPRLPYAARRAMVAARDRLRPPTVGRVVWSPYDEESWLEANLGWARDVAFASDRSPVFSFIHRGKLEHLLRDGTSPDLRRLNQLPIFAALTMLLFEQVEASLARSSR
jgi:asparagine synthase (glutamine-hydrolysing)